MNKTFLIIGGIVVLAGIGWYLWSTGTLIQPGPEEGPEETDEIVVNLAEQNDSGESGTATIIEEAGGVRVVLRLTGSPEGVAQPAHIHVNSCANIGGVQYPLAPVVDGFSDTTVGASLEDLRTDLPLSINVHKSAEEASVYVACGDIEL